MRRLRDVLWEALGPAAATPEDLPDLRSHRSSRSLNHSEMDRSPEALAESALDAVRAERSETPQRHSEVVEVAHESALLPGVSNGAPQDVFRRAHAHDFELCRAATLLGRLPRMTGPRYAAKD